MTGREKLLDLVRTLRDDSERCEHMARGLIEKMLKSQEMAEALTIAEQGLTDAQCDVITSEWDFGGAN